MMMQKRVFLRVLTIFVYKKILCIENVNTKLKRSYIKTEFTRTHNRKIKKCFLLTF